jgi:hypothetical protein
MSSRGSVSRLIDALPDEVAECKLNDLYFNRLVGLARKKLGAASKRVADEYDVANEVLDCLFRGARQGNFPFLRHRDDLWRLMVKLTGYKSANQIKYLSTQMRVPANGLRGDSGFEGDGGINGVVGKNPDPPTVVTLKEGFHKLLEVLDDKLLQQIAILKMDGYTNVEIAEQLGWSRATIDLKLKLIRTKWRARL